MLQENNLPNFDTGYIVMREYAGGSFEPAAYNEDVAGTATVEFFQTEDEAKLSIIEHAKDIIDAIETGNMDLDAFNDVYALSVAECFLDSEQHEITVNAYGDPDDILFEGSIYRK